MTERVYDRISAGGVLFRRSEAGVDVVLIQPRADRWQLPKGGIEPGETREEAARREVREESGIDGRVLEFLATIEFSFAGPARGHRRWKVVHHFLLECERGDTASHDDEVLESRWFPIDEAEKTLTFANERRIVALAREKIATLSGGVAPPR